VDSSARRSALIAFLQQDGRVEVAAAAARFGSAEMTVRRDLDVLVDRGIARRVRGGAISLLMRGEEPPFDARAVEAADRKQRIGRVVADLLAEGESVIIDSGTTALEVARRLGGKRLTVMPLSLHSAQVLAGFDSVRLLMPGGEVRPVELAMVGPLAVAGIEALRFDTAVLSCCGLAGGSVTAHDIGEADVKKAMRSSAARTVLVAHSSKFAHSAMAVVCETRQVDVMVTDGLAPPDVTSALRAEGVEVLPV
jgi:DeoR/GlpR family transcriptional regulator of sugar metabolism